MASTVGSTVAPPAGAGDAQRLAAKIEELDKEKQVLICLWLALKLNIPNKRSAQEAGA